MSTIASKTAKVEETIAAPDNSALAAERQETLFGMGFLARVVQLPVVKQAITVASSIYGKLKGSNRVMNWTLTRAELTMDHATEALPPPAECLTKPLEKADNLLCSSLDYLENNVPAVKLPPRQMLTGTKNYLYNVLHRVWDFTLSKASSVQLYVFGTSFSAFTSSSKKSVGTEASSLPKSSDNLPASSSGRPDLAVYTSPADIVDYIEQLQVIKKRLEEKSQAVTSSS